MRIKKKQIKEMVSDTANNAKEIGTAAIDMKNDLENAGFDNAEEIVAGVVAGDEEDDSGMTSEGDDAVSRGIGAGVNPELGSHEIQKDVNNDWDGENGGADYGEEPKKKSNSLKGLDYNDKDLPFESVNPKMTKSQLAEAILGSKERKVIKTLKVKDLRK